MPNRDSPPAVLLRESYRDAGGRSQKRTLANLSKLPWDANRGSEGAAQGRNSDRGGEPRSLTIERSLPHGHVAAALGMIRKIALDRLILSTATECRSRVAIAISL